ncbi:MAG: flagellar protein FliT [Pseudomonadota bacterium]
MSAVLADPPPSRGADLDRLLDATRALRAALDVDDWGRAADLERDRRLLMERIFDGTPPAAADLAGFAAVLREVVRLNDELIGIAEHRRRALQREADVASIGRAALKAYGDAGA